MASSRKNKSNKKGIDTLLEKGVLLTGAGVTVWLSPLFLGSAPLLKPVAQGLRGFAWPLVILGLVLIAVHFAFKNKVAKTADLPATAATQREPVLLHTALATAPISSPAGSFAKAPVASPASALPLPATAWSPAVFAAIEWRRFEAVCEALFAQAGFSTRSQSHGADGGVDIWLHSPNAQGPVSVAQCKHWKSKPVGVKEMREFFGVMASHQLKRGTYATTSTYTQDAQQFAKDNSINALDGPALLALIAKRTPDQQHALLAVAYEGHYWRPTCASCGTKMVERAPAKGGAGFWGCTGYPKCRARMQMAG
jgi:restriction system protein